MIPTATWVSRPHTHCRVCGAPLGKPYLDLGEQPLANALVPVGERHDRTPRRRKPDPTFPLQVILCEQCGLSQLSVVVNPEVLYARSYPFQSGVSGLWRSHCEELAEKASLAQKPGFVIDIAANDGTQLVFLEKWGWRTLGVEPAQVPLADFGAMPYEKRAPITMLRRFWSEHTAKMVLAHHGQADLVIAQNVLGHVDDPIAFLKACKAVLAPEGRVVVEVPDAFAMLRNLAFDTIYHEHLSYWTRSALRAAAETAELVIERNDAIPVHGGSRRYWLKHRTPRPARRFNAMKSALYAAFAQRVEENLYSCGILLCQLRGKRMIGWGASAKAAVYLNAVVPWTPASADLPDAVIDECPEKQGMLMSGVHIPIIPVPESLADTDVIWVLSWNNALGIKAKAMARGFKGKFLLTNGTPRLEDA